MTGDASSLFFRTIAGQKVWQVCLFFGIILLSSVLGRLSRFFMEGTSRRMGARGRELAALVLRVLAKPAVFLAIAVGAHLGLSVLNVQGGLPKALATVSQVLYAAAIGYAAYRLVDVVDYYLSRLAKRTAGTMDDMLAPLVGRSIRITVVVLVVLQLIQAFSDKPVTSIIAGLGVGGLAVALAGQDTPKNFFGSLVILGDRPFEVGDRIVFDGHDGPVEHVGFRSTRIRTLDGHLVTVPNSEMVNRTVQNVGRRPYIRRVANITITYNTPPEKVAQAVDILKEILDNHQGMHPDLPPRVYFSDFNEWSLNLLAIYWFHPPDYWQYMSFSERVNHEILRRFNAEGIEFAFPTQTVFLARDG